jgi:hypothetical protein
MAIEMCQDVVKDFPLGTKLTWQGKPIWVMGYYAPDHLICASIDPMEDYTTALNSCWSYNSVEFRVKH